MARRTVRRSRCRWARRTWPSRSRKTPPAAPNAARSWSATAAATSASTAAQRAVAADPSQYTGNVAQDDDGPPTDQPRCGYCGKLLVDGTGTGSGWLDEGLFCDFEHYRLAHPEWEDAARRRIEQARRTVN